LASDLGSLRRDGAASALRGGGHLALGSSRRSCSARRALAGLLHIWIWGWPAALFVLALVSILTVAPRQSAWRLLVIGCLAFSAPLVAYIGASLVMFYTSYDTTPWTGAVTGFALIIAGIALWPAFAQPATSDEDHQDSGMAGPASEVEHVAPLVTWADSGAVGTSIYAAAGPSIPVHSRVAERGRTVKRR
jgi:hypothetical protein